MVRTVLDWSECCSIGQTTISLVIVLLDRADYSSVCKGTSANSELTNQARATDTVSTKRPALLRQQSPTSSSARSVPRRYVRQQWLILHVTVSSAVLRVHISNCGLYRQTCARWPDGTEVLFLFCKQLLFEIREVSSLQPATAC